MKFQAFHVNPGEKLKEKDVNNDLSNFMSVFPNLQPAGNSVVYMIRPQLMSDGASNR